MNTGDNPDFDETSDDDESVICSNCNGSGEGMHEGTCCHVCGGTGEVASEQSRADDEADRADYENDRRREAAWELEQELNDHD